ncbi:MAG: hypothetical protein HY226_06415 [Candidatus Vogelbacteria bacterium]|nr:hypothetical protein [Candidatus Vogelbacteria bacterium]
MNFTTHSKNRLPATVDAKELINELQNDFREFSNVSDTFQGEKRWLDNIKRLSELVSTEDPRHFLQWDVIKRTMEVGNADFVGTELSFLRNGTDWNRWQQAIREVSVGDPTLSAIYPASSGNLIHHAYHIAQFEGRTGIDIRSFDYIFEFGGGYGGMYRLIHNLGFEGKYVIFDFPAFAALQRYFIKSIGLKSHTVESFKLDTSGVICVSDFQELKNILSEFLPNALFIATWSLSECPIDFRLKILSLLDQFRAYLVAYQGRFEGQDNIQFFDSWKKSRQQYDWHNYKIDHIPNDYYFNNYYLIAQRTL